MKKREYLTAPATGGSSLLVIFAVLCLVIFSLLSLNTVLSEKRISEASARVAEDWYAADLQAQEIFARLRAGERVDGVMQTGQTYAYAVPVSGHQTLLVVLKEKEGCWEVVTWRSEAHGEDVNTHLPVWQGTEEESYG